MVTRLVLKSQHLRHLFHFDKGFRVSVPEMEGIREKSKKEMLGRKEGGRKAGGGGGGRKEKGLWVSFNSYALS